MISSSVGFGFSERSSFVIRTKPGMQYPHCIASLSTNDETTGIVFGQAVGRGQLGVRVAHGGRQARGHAHAVGQHGTGAAGRRLRTPLWRW